VVGDVRRDVLGRHNVPRRGTETVAE